MKDMDAIEKLKLFEDTPNIVKELKGSGWEAYGRHLQELWILTRQLGNEVKRHRKEKANGNT
jgi:hypothetical protein